MLLGTTRTAVLVPLVLLAGCGSAADQPPGNTAGFTSSPAPAGAAGVSSSAGGAPAAPGAGGSGAEATGGTSANGGLAGAGSGIPAPALAPHAIAATYGGTCALDALGTIHCWGLAPEVWEVPAGSFQELYGSDDAVCAVRADRSVACFGEPGHLPDLSIAPQGNVSTLGLSRGALCGIDEAGATFCNWSSSPWDDMAPPADPLEDLAVGYQFACGIRKSDSSLLCWGSPGSEDCAWAPAAGQLDSPAGAFVAVASRWFHSCAIDAAGQVHCWGAGEATDDPEQECRSSPINFGQSVPPAGSFQQVSTGDVHSCAVARDGSVACWGEGTADECESLGCRQAIPPAGEFAQVACGGYHTCAMRADRTVACWGWDGDGDGRTTPPPAFQ